MAQTYSGKRENKLHGSSYQKNEKNLFSFLMLFTWRTHKPLSIIFLSCHNEKEILWSLCLLIDTFQTFHLSIRITCSPKEDIQFTGGCNLKQANSSSEDTLEYKMCAPQIYLAALNKIAPLLIYIQILITTLSNIFF